MTEEHVRPEHDQYGQRNGHREPHKVKGRLVRHVVGDLLGRLGRLRDPLVLPVAHVGPTAAVVEVLGAERRVDALGVVALARVGEATLHRHFDLVCREEIILKFKYQKTFKYYALVTLLVLHTTKQPTGLSGSPSESQVSTPTVQSPSLHAYDSQTSPLAPLGTASGLLLRLSAASSWTVTALGKIEGKQDEKGEILKITQL